ncbi:MAG: protoporphyrinogen oxidase [Xanthomonadales bacterium]
MTDTDVLVVGGGISGLATAWWLSRAGIPTTLWEQRAKPGGKIRSDSINGYLLEQGATMVMNFRPEVDQFISDAGLDKLKIRRDALAEEKRYLLQRGRLVTVPTRLGRVPFSSAWSLNGKLRMLIEPLIRKGGSETETVSEFIRRRLGKELLETAMEPFVSGTLASDADLANAYSVMPRLTALEQRYGSIVIGVIANKLRKRCTAMKSEVFSFRGGMATLIDRLTDTLRISGEAGFQSQISVTSVERRNDAWIVYADSPTGAQTISARQVVLCTPASVSASLVQELDSELSHLLGDIHYAAMSVVHLGLDLAKVEHPMNGTGFLVPRKEALTISGTLWMSAIFPDRSPTGKALLTTYLGGPRHPEAVEWSDERSVDTVLGDIGSILGIKAGPEMVHVHRDHQALPLYHGSYYGRCNAIRNRVEQLPGLHLQANYLGGISVRDRLLTSKATALQIMEKLGLPPKFGILFPVTGI